jgi:hypothetical protein
VLLVPLVVLGLLLFIVLGGVIVLQLWNWLLPALFGWPRITFWQALGLLALSRILFGGLGIHRRTRSRVRDRISERCGEISPEKRERIRQRMRERFESSPSEGEGQPGPG